MDSEGRGVDGSTGPEVKVADVFRQVSMQAPVNPCFAPPPPLEPASPHPPAIPTWPRVPGPASCESWCLGIFLGRFGLKILKSEKTSENYRKLRADFVIFVL